MTACLLRITIGGAPEPIARSLRHRLAARVVFIVTPQTRETITRNIDFRVGPGGWPEFDPGRHDLREVTDPQEDIVSARLARQLFAIAHQLLPVGETELPMAPSAALNPQPSTLNRP